MRNLLQRALRPVTTLVAGVVMAWGASVAGVVELADAAVAQEFLEWRGTRDSAQRVLLVAATEDTVDAWGPPPWEPARLAQLAVRLQEGHPASVAVVGQERAFTELDAAGLETPEGAELQAFVERGQLLLPQIAAAPNAEGPLAATVTGIRLDGDLHRPQRASLNALLERTALPPVGDAVLDIAWLRPHSRLPTVPAHRVARGDIPPGTFTGRIVVIGVTAPSQTVALPTPVGPLSTAEIQAQALLTVADSAAPKKVSPLTQGLLLLASLLALGVVLPRPRLRPAVLTAGGLMTLWSAGAFVAGSYGLLLQATAPMVAIAAAVVVHTLWRAVRLNRAAVALARTVDEQLDRDQGRDATEAPATEDADLWDDLGAIAAAYLGPNVQSSLAELPEGQHGLVFRTHAGCADDDIREPRRDVRRTPYRNGFLTHRSDWSARFLEGGRHTLLVPLVHAGHLLGFWLAHFLEEDKPDVDGQRSIEALARQLAASLAERRGLAPDPMQRAAKSSDPAAQLAVFTEGVRMLADRRDWAGNVLDALPLPVMLASVWGKVLFSNAAMNDRLQPEFPEGIPDNDVRAVIARLGDTDLAGAHTSLRWVVRESAAVDLSGGDDILRELSESPRLIMTRVRVDEEGDRDLILIVASDVRIGAANHEIRAIART